MQGKIQILAELAMVFLKIGAFTFGGGYAMLPLLQSELADKRKWLTAEKLMDYFCIGQTTPGIIAVNVATFVGYEKARVGGAVTATIALITVPVAIILSLANLLSIYMANPYVAKAFIGIRIVVTALIAEAVFKLWKTAVKSYVDAAVFLTALLLSTVAGLSPIGIVLFFAALGTLRYVRSRKK